MPINAKLVVVGGEVKTAEIKLRLPSTIGRGRGCTIMLPQALVSITVMPFTGAKSTFDTIQLALEALEKAYLAAGYGSVKIEVPEQDLKDGVVRLLVVEARLDRVPCSRRF